MKSDLPRSARDIVGPTGWMWSKGWDELARHQATYARSFDRRVPPSLFVTAEERGRHNIPIPLVERMIDRHGEDHDETVPKPEAPG